MITDLHQQWLSSGGVRNGGRVVEKLSDSPPSNDLYHQFLLRAQPIINPVMKIDPDEIPQQDENDSTSYEDSLIGSDGSPTGCPLNLLSPLPIVITPSQPMKKFKNIRKSDQFKCAVCGDKPTGYHYGTISCNGCKTFFRRTIIANRKFTCSKGGRCCFDKDFRCACRACRFQKCVLVGMDPSAIQYPTKAEKQEIFDDEDMPSTSTDAYEQQLQVVSLASRDDLAFTELLDNLMRRETSSVYMRRTECPWSFEMSLPELLKKPCILGKSFVDMCKVTAEESTLQAYHQNPIRFWMVADMFLACEYAKTFGQFHQLSELDRRILLSQAVGLIIMLVQSFYSLEQKSEKLLFPDGTDALDFQMNRFNFKFEDYFRENYCRPIAMLRACGMEKQHYVLMKAIVLFSPGACELSDEGRIVVDKERSRLCTALHRLLIAQLGEQKGSLRYANYLMNIENFVRLNEKKRSHLELSELVRKVRLTPLGEEIYLKRHFKYNL
ncbi:unnamed protein product, partial [Mesorhabditis belari]|uniref:Uncharacterized protein n=1 Tax=Mesorhabditis belari TaxID=2138241 RepID=A0AAF3EVD6_9BILA